jgi:hypothetical protein
MKLLIEGLRWLKSTKEIEILPAKTERISREVGWTDRAPKKIKVKGAQNSKI